MLLAKQTFLDCIVKKMLGALKRISVINVSYSKLIEIMLQRYTVVEI